jgi:hypothetical protein
MILKDDNDNLKMKEFRNILYVIRIIRNNHNSVYC